jgi:mannose-1-phosphate guanylyltransferase / mannose-6-phosphate isomerase
MENLMIRPVILCGGAGTRLWPVSRQLFPKQLLSLVGEQSLLQQTALRLTGVEFAPAIIVSGEDQGISVERQLEQAGAPVEAILLEPIARNTSAAAALAAAWMAAVGRDELLLLVPSDHVILNREAFVAAVGVAAPHAEAGSIVTFGAQPTEPNTQYGYIEAQVERGSGDGAYPIARFVEKPNAKRAGEYLATGRFYWNAGIFLLKASTLLSEMREFLPESFDAISNAVAERSEDGRFVRPDAEAFEKATNISIDHAIMEKTSRGMVVPVKMDWSDVGSWDAVWQLGEKDANRNIIAGDVMALDTSRSLLRNEGGPLITTVGLDRMAVIAVADAVFISPMDRVSEVKEIVEALKAEARKCVVSAPKLAPLSKSGEPVLQGARFQIAHIVINPGSRSSAGRDLHWSKHCFIVRGRAEVSLGEKVTTVRENETIFIPKAMSHQIENICDVPLEFVEIRYDDHTAE